MRAIAFVRSWKERILYTPGKSSEEQNRIRAVVNSLVLHLHPTRVPARALRFSYTWGLGGISALLTVTLALTGVLLMFRYEPSVERAYISIQMLETKVIFGSLVRAIHHWSANLLVITTFLHLLRVFFTGGFKRERATNWQIGILLLMLVLAFNFTGYLLPWDQLAYWAITVSTSMVRYIPWIGPTLSDFVLGGPEVGQGALSNFYALHVALLPALLIATMSYHFWKVRKDGGISLPPPADGEPVERLTTIPHLVRVEFAAAAVVLTAVVLWAMLMPAPLKELANPIRSPNPAKAAWYFVGFQELLLHMDTLAAVVLVSVVLLGAVVLPRWDTREDNVGVYFRSGLGRRAALLGALASLYLVPLLVVADEYWIELPALFPGWPSSLSGGLIPLVVTLAGLAAVYGGIRLILKADHSEGLTGLFTFVAVSVVLLTIVGAFCRGPNMALVLPF